MTPARRPVTVERRDLSATVPARLQPKPDAAAQLREVAGLLQHLPRDCLIDRAELLMLLRRLAGRLMVIADSGLARAQDARQPRQPFLARPRADPMALAEGVFGAGHRRANPSTTTQSRKGKTVKVEVRRRTGSSPGQLALFPMQETCP